MTMVSTERNLVHSHGEKIWWLLGDNMIQVNDMYYALSPGEEIVESGERGGQ